MQYVFAKSFNKQFKKLPKTVKVKTLERMTMFFNNEEDRRLNNHSLKGEWMGYRSINITGDIRALYKVSDKNIAVFSAIGSHSELYQ